MKPSIKKKASTLKDETLKKKIQTNICLRDKIRKKIQFKKKSKKIQPKMTNKKTRDYRESIWKFIENPT
jgi:hypothetical protein